MIEMLLSFLGAGKYWLIAITVASTVAFAGGYFEATSHFSKIQARALISARSEAASAQAIKDSRDFAVAKADLEKRAVISKKAETKFQVIYRDRKVLVPNPTKCRVPATAMKTLNDPSLIGVSP